MSDPADNLDALTALVEVHGSPQLATWWCGSLAEFNAHAGRKSLSACLGIELCSGQFPTRRAAKEARDRHLRKAYTLMSNQSVRGFQARIRWFRMNIFPEVQMYLVPPKALSPVARELFLAARTSTRIPDSVSQLSEILSGKVGEQVENRTVSPEPALERAADGDSLYESEEEEKCNSN